MRRGIRVPIAVLLGALTGGVVMLALPGAGPAGRERAPVIPEDDPPAPRIEGKAGIPTLLVWTPGGLPAGLPEAILRLPEVRAATAVRSGTVWLDAWEVDERIERAPRGLGVPVEVAAIHPRSYRRFVPPAERSAIEGLDAGRAILGRSAAELRGIGPGSLLRIGGMELRVAGVLDDELVGATEIVVSIATGRRLGVMRPRYVLVEPRPEVPRRSLEQRIRSLLPPGVRSRIRGPGETPIFRHGDAVLPPITVKEIFGEFGAVPRADGMLGIDPAWERRNIRSSRVPILGRVRCHRLVLPALRGALVDLERRGLGSLIDPADYGGCYAPRFANRNPSAGLSRHSWGIAVDLNVSENPLGREPRLDRRVVETFERYGFTWGGRWLVPDGMHFEFVAFPAKG